MQFDEIESNSLSAKLLALGKKYFLQIFFGLSIVVFAIVAYVATSSPHSQPKKSVLAAATYIPRSSSGPIASSSASGQILVDVAGAVITPGVYQLPAGSRVEDAVVLAGGFDQDNIDKDFVARQLNLAAKLTDGQKIYILHQGENTSLVQTGVLTAISSDGTTPTTDSTSASTTPSGPIDVNTASATELDTLPGVGPVTANKIIQGRPYNSVQDLLSKKAVGQSVFGKIQNQITI